jgi:pimeloyl-ACP methyl ester carboxylesterase
VEPSVQHEGSDHDIAHVRWIDVEGGKLPVRSIGSGPVVLFLHGWTLDWRIWLPQSPLARGMQIVFPDRRGFGGSTAPPLLAAERDDINAIADHFGARKFALVGLSQGASVALDYARSNPERLNSLAVIGAPLHRLVPESGDVPEIDRPALSDLVRAGRLPDMIGQWRCHPLTQVNGQNRALLDEILHDYDGRDQLVDQDALDISLSGLRSLPVPTMALAGENDSEWRKEVAQFIGANIPHAIAKFVPDAGHLANIDQPATVNALIQNFFENNSSKED